MKVNNMILFGEHKFTMEDLPQNKKHNSKHLFILINSIKNYISYYL